MYSILGAYICMYISAALIIGQENHNMWINHYHCIKKTNIYDANCSKYIYGTLQFVHIPLSVIQTKITRNKCTIIFKGEITALSNILRQWNLWL